LGKCCSAGGLADALLADEIADRYSRLREEEMHLFPHALDVLKHYRERGVRLCLITNGAAATQRAKVERFGLAGHFDHIQIEGEHGFGKPELRAYEHALRNWMRRPKKAGSSVTILCGKSRRHRRWAFMRSGLTESARACLQART
jgi:FMN phosphatase YigB (HAD superfamily)